MCEMCEEFSGVEDGQSEDEKRLASAELLHWHKMLEARSQRSFVQIQRSRLMRLRSMLDEERRDMESFSFSSMSR